MTTKCLGSVRGSCFRRSPTGGEGGQPSAASIIELCVADHQNDLPSLERWLRNKTVEHFVAWLADPATAVVVGEQRSVICGVGLVSQDGDLTLLYLAPGWQGRGLGSAILSVLEKRARSWGLRELRLLAARDSRGFYERHGYIPDGEPRRAYGVVDDIPYRKDL